MSSSKADPMKGHDEKALAARFNKPALTAEEREAEEDRAAKRAERSRKRTRIILILFAVIAAGLLVAQAFGDTLAKIGVVFGF